MKYEHHDIALLAAELRRFSEAVIGGPHDTAAEVLLELYDAYDQQTQLANEYRQMYLYKTRENNRFRRLLNLKHLPLLRNTAAADMAQLVDLHNRARARSSWWATIPPLTLDDKLAAYAQKHAQHMADTQRLRHSDIKALLQLGYSRAAENIAAGQSTPERVLAEWLWSLGHRRNILNAAYDKLGCGAAKDAHGTLYWCVCFGRS